MSPAKRRALDRFARAERSPLRAGPVSPPRGPRAGGRPETLGAELGLFFAFVWRRLLVAGTPRARRPRAAAADRCPPAPLARAQARAPRAATTQRVGIVASQDRPARADGARRRARARQPADPDHRPRALLRRLHRRSSTSRAGSRSAARRVRIVTVDPVGTAPAVLAAAARVLQRPGRPVRPCRGRLRPRVAGGRGESLRPLRRHDLVDGPHRAAAALAHARRRALSLPDPGVRAVHVPDGHLRGAGDRVLPLPALRAVLHRVAARLLSRARDRRVYAAGATAGDAASASFQNAITAVDRPRRAPSWRGGHAQAALLRAARAARCAEHVRARRAGARAGRSRRAPSATAGSSTGSAPSTRGARMPLGGGAVLELLPRSEQDGYADCCAITTWASR